MDKNTITGLVLIVLLLIGFSYFSRPSQEQQEAFKRYNDSITIVKQKEEALREKTAAALANEKEIVTIDSTSTFFNAIEGVEGTVVIENELLTAVIDNKGGRVTKVTLKEYNDQEKQPLVLFDGNEMMMNFYFYNKKEAIQTKDYYFIPVNQSEMGVTMRLVAGEESYIDFIYQLKPDNYLLDFTIQAVGMENLLAHSVDYLNIEWSQRARQLERGSVFEKRLSNLTYKYVADKTDNLAEAKDDEETIDRRLNWIAYKNQFFSSVFIADQSFSENILKSRVGKEGNDYIKDYSSEMRTSFDPKGEAPTTMHFYFGPNHYKTLKAYDKGKSGDSKWKLNDLVYLGWPVVKQINQWFTVNIFDWLSSWGLGMGLVLFLMTVLVKIVVFPATWKTYMSSAKMRVLRPEIEKINAKYPKQEDAMKKQQETMALYSKYGVSPMGGCLPMLLQFPILMALFMFVPSAIELRQESFLWANDLSTYDAILKLPFNIPFMGSHISLFCLLMTVTTILNTKYTMSQQDTGQQQMPGMKWMMYLMPVMFLFILNSYPAGLNYYYFISTLISVVTMIVLRKTTNEEKLLAGLEANKTKNKTKKKSGFAARLEAMQKEQERMLKERQKK
ncbi:membrane protein insertase YidC [Bacteroides sp. 214]|uniref:membrane protein insertase YidC n=1 Tax=Bacteroides sp. 214 TaxID=2302935 RepID=UPI0013D36778|nr:membrane protein insertase YidC [Bacteroides sp. 214]NDW11563.1 membrane protein insertase YidC [Bacteroides sp. 214]